ncbi:exonuclease SbcD [Pseudomonas aeruginosa]|nr:exonuclease SbcD [Pseudomonas aeruginosa]
MPVGGMYEAHGTLVESGGAVARIPYMRQQKERVGQASL